MKQKPITAMQVILMEPAAFVEDTSYVRNKRGDILKDPATGKPLGERQKREWSFEGSHTVVLEDGTLENRPGHYAIKMKRP